MTTQKHNPKITKTIKNSDPLSSLKKKLKVCDLEIKNYVRALEAENLKLHEQIAKLQVKNVSLNNQVNVLIKEVEKKGPSISELIKQATEENLRKHN